MVGRKGYLLGFVFAITGLVVASAQTIPAGYQEFYIVGNEEHIWNMFLAVRAGEGSVCTFSPAQMSSIVVLAVSLDNQQVYYDHWEDGLETNIFNPVQATTLVLGDNNPANGSATDYTTDTRITGDFILRGTFFRFNSDQTSGSTDRLAIPIPRNAADLRYDGGDRIFTTGGPVAVARFQWPLGCEVIGSSMEILSRQAVENAFSYSIPVGTNTYSRYGGNNTPGEPFKYVFLDLVAFENNTQVFIDNLSGQTVSISLNKGQHYSSQGWIDSSIASAIPILEGTKVITNKPVAGMIYTAGDGTYQDRSFALMPDLMHSTDFVISAPGDNPGINGNRPLNLYIYNPDRTNSITVSATDSLGTGSFVVPPNQVRAYSETAAMNRFVPANSTVRLTSSSLFWGFSAYDHRGVIADWGHSWLATRFLTNFYSVPYSPGTSDPASAYAARSARGCDGINPCNSENRSPLFISAVENNTRIQIDLDNNGVFDVIDTNSDDVPDTPDDPTTNTYILDALQSLRVFDHTDYQNTGTQIHSNKKIVVAFGQDTDQGETNDDTLDLGHMIYPLDQRWLDPVLTMEKTGDRGFVPLEGGIVTFTLTVRTYKFGPLSNVQVYDLLPSGPSYVPGSTIITYPDGSQSFNDPTISGNRLDWNLSPNTLNPQSVLAIRFQLAFPSSPQPTLYKNRAQVDANLGSGSLFSPTASFDVVQTAVALTKSVSSSTAITGQTLTYSIQVNNNGTTPETGVIVLDPIPYGTTFSGSITSNNPAFSGVYDPAQNAVVWTASNFPAGTGALLTFQVRVNSDVSNGEILRNQASYESNETPEFESLETTTTVLGPDLRVSKSGPAVAAPGDILTYSISISNVGPAAANSLILSDPFPANTSYLSESMDYRLNTGPYISLTDNNSGDDPGYLLGNRVEFRLTSLAAGNTVTFRFKVTVVPNLLPPAFVNNYATYSTTEITSTDTNLVQTSILQSSAITPSPMINSPIFENATSVSGTSPSPDGTVIQVYVNGIFAGQTTVSGGTWMLSGIPPLQAGNIITADATESGKSTSNPSSPVAVSQLGATSPAPAVRPPLYSGETSISGTSLSPDGTLIDVFVNGVFVGQTTVVANVWILTGIAPLQTSQVVQATATETGKGTSSLSTPVTVEPLPDIVKRSSANGQRVSAGQTLTYTIRITNNSSQTWNNIVVTDNVPANTTYITGSSRITAPGTVTDTYRDELTTVSYSGNNGTLNWNTSWAEISDDGNVNTGDVNVVADLGDNSLHIQDDNNGLTRQANLNGYTSATLSFDYRRVSLDNSNEYVTIEISTGGPFVEIGRFSGPATDSSYLTFSADITSYISATTTIRFLSSAAMDDPDDFYVDNVQILVQKNGLVTTPGCAPPTLVGAAGCSGYNLLPGQTITVTFQVTIDTPLPAGTTEISNIASFTADEVPSPLSASITDFVSGIPDLLRNDQVTSLSLYNPVTIFPLDSFGPDLIPGEGEGALQQGNGSSDDDDHYKSACPNPYLDPDPTLLTDANRPLVFYQLNCNACILLVTKQGSQIRIQY